MPGTVPPAATTATGSTTGIAWSPPPPGRTRRAAAVQSAAEASTAHGLSPSFVVHDELGQVRGPRSELYEALETATAAHKQPLTIIISTQAPHDADLLSQLIDDAKAAHDPQTVLRLFTAADELDPFSDEAIIAANPAFGDFQNADEVRAMAQTAKRMSAAEASYRNLVLNQRVAAETRLFRRTSGKRAAPSRSRSRASRFTAGSTCRRPTI